MDDQRIEKIKSEIEKTKAKISEYQLKLRDQEREKIRLENERIVALVRGERISDAELSALMASFRRCEPAGAPASAKPTRQEETLYADHDEE